MAARPGISIKVLGPWEVRIGDEPVAIPYGQLRVVLSVLLLAGEEAVTTSVLAERLWPDHPHERNRNTLHTYVRRLRRALGADLIATTPGGRYRVDLEPEAVDLYTFRDLIRLADKATSADDELILLRQALGLWRGRPFGDVSSSWLDRAVVPRLMEEWFTATERRIDLELAAGQANRLVAELRELAGQYRTRESLWLRLITALYRTGRRAEALDAFQQVRASLSNELGIDPGEQLVLLQRQILRDGSDPVEDAVAAPGVRQLPHGIPRLCGRSEELATLDALVERPVESTIVAIEGAAGTGKTTLAVHWAHRMADRYPDAQLYLNLRGYGPGGSVTPAEAAETLLRVLGVANDVIPARLEERSALLRSVLAGRRALILLDNAKDASQVRPLLPGSSSLVVVTSRNQLRGLSVREGAHRVTLGRLAESDAVELLATAIGPDRVATDPEAVARLARLCDYLPLALAIVAERAYRTAGPGELADALADETARLDHLDAGEDDPYTSLRAVLSWSYRELSPGAAAMLRLLGLHPADDLAVETAAALADQPVPRVRELLDQLVVANLVEQRRLRRYELHDLIRLYAIDQARRHDSPAEQEAAVRRVLDWYLHGVTSADRHLFRLRRRDFLDGYEPNTPPPEFADVTEALTWLEEEYESLVKVVRWAAGAGFIGHAWRIAVALLTFFDRHRPAHFGIEFYESMLTATEAAGDRLGAAYLLNALGCAHYGRGELRSAIPPLARALAWFEEIGDVRGEAMMHGNLGLVFGELGEHAKAYRHSQLALDRCERLGYRRGIAINLDNVGAAHTAKGDFAEAVVSHLRSHAINIELGDLNSEAMNQHHLGCAYAGLNNFRRAAAAFRTAIMLYRRLGTRSGEAVVLVDLGKMLAKAGHPDLARALLRTAFAALSEFSDSRAADVEIALATLDRLSHPASRGAADRHGEREAPA